MLIVQTPGQNATPTTGTFNLPAPQVLSTVPSDNAIGVAYGANIKVVFSQAMDKGSVQDAFRITYPPAGVAGGFSWSADGRVMTFNPNHDFKHDDVIRYVIEKTAKSQFGIAMETKVEVNFQVLRVRTVNLQSDPRQTGTVNQPQGDIYSAIGFYYTGGDWRAFYGFDLSVLPKDLVRITDANLTLWQMEHKPAAYGPTTGPLLVQSVYFGTDLSFAAVYAHVNTFCLPQCASLQVPITAPADTKKQVDVTTLVAGDWGRREAQGSRSQFRLRFSKTDANDVTAAFYSFADASHKPSLQITYEY